jgi:pimeloyl-ACP methyl ester carboxylesterase
MKISPFPLETIAVTVKPGEPDKRPFVFLHGNSQNSSCGQAVLEFFSQRGHQVLSYDLPGHGDSVLDSEEYVFDDLIDLNQQILQRYQIENPILCGHSLGGMIHAGSIARYKIKDASLILCGSLDANPTFVGPKCLPKEKAEELSKALDAYMGEGFRLFKRQHKYDYFENRQVEDEIVNIINRRYSNPQASFINLNTLREFDARKALIEMKIPVVVMHGQKEQVIHPELVKAMVAEYQNIILCWYPENGHLAFYQQPLLTDEFLQKHYSFLSS